MGVSGVCRNQGQAGRAAGTGVGSRAAGAPEDAAHPGPARLGLATFKQTPSSLADICVPFWRPVRDRLHEDAELNQESSLGLVSRLGGASFGDTRDVLD